MTWTFDHKGFAADVRQMIADMRERPKAAVVQRKLSDDEFDEMVAREERDERYL